MQRRIDASGEIEALAEREAPQIPDDRETVRALPEFDQGRKDDVVRDDLASEGLDDGAPTDGARSAEDSSPTDARIADGGAPMTSPGRSMRAENSLDGNDVEP